MSERDLQAFLQNIEGIEKDAEVFEVESKAWHHAVTISDYLKMFRIGSTLSTTIYGNPYSSRVEALRNCEYSDKLATLHQQLASEGFHMLEFPKPNLDELFPGPVDKNILDDRDPFSRSKIDGLRRIYFEHFFGMMYDWGYRDLMAIGINGYLNQVPDTLSLFTFQAPDGTKSFISQDGYVAIGLDPAPNFERPFSQRGATFQGFMQPGPRSEQYFEDLTSQIAYITAYPDNFTFDGLDLLGYRPKDSVVKTDEA